MITKTELLNEVAFRLTPTTLAGVIAELQANEDARPYAVQLTIERFTAQLAALVGDDEAVTMVNETQR